MQNLKIGAVENFLHEIKLILKLRKESVPLNVSLHEREIQIGTKRQRLLVNVGAAADENFAACDVGIRRIDSAQVRDGLHAGILETGPAQNNRGAVRQR